MAEQTPMKKQYDAIKRQHTDCMLFFRLGDFYEMFDEDAKIASKELDLALTTRDRGKPEEEQTPMCGVPYHSAQAYIARLIAKGYKIAVCEQLEDPATAKGLVERDVIRIITPGTVTDSSMLEAGRSNYLGAVYLDAQGSGAAFCDVSTGEFCATSFDGADAGRIVNELGRFSPKEAVLCPASAQNEEITAFLSDKLGALAEKGAAEIFSLDEASARVGAQFNAGAQELALSPAALRAAGALLYYLSDTQRCDLSHIDKLEVYGGGRYMELDWAARRNLEITEAMRTGEKRGSLLWVLDKTKTPMGSRLLRAWLERPLLSPAAIRRRQSAVEELYRDNVRRAEIMLTLRAISDMQRIVGKAVCGTANARDLQMLANSARVLPELSERLSVFSAAMLRECAGVDTLADITNEIDRAICDAPPFSVREGGMLRTGYSEEVDRLREMRDNGAGMIAALEAREQERTGCKKLKIGYNRVFGYYIEAPNSANLTPPPEYVRRQTLVSSERYVTTELKDLESNLMSAKERINDLEFHFFDELRRLVAKNVERVKATADLVAAVDVLCSLAEAAVKNGYVCPEVDASREIRISDGRHPVVEATMRDVLFVPNDVYLNATTDRAAIVTGPNMAGKSTYMRQTALMVIMAQIGSFVPAKSAVIGVCDKIFTRIGASDDLSSGQSTFMVEMNEVASILKNATASSLLILDEIGRGTSTYDGMAIARAVLEYCADKRRLGARTMFATHYHELSALENELEGVKNYNITAKKQGGSLVFLRKVVRGAADDSYGIEVAKLAGVPEGVIARARGFLKELEGGGAAPRASFEAPDEQLSMEELGALEAGRALRDADLNTLTPIEAMNLLYKLQKKAEGQ